MPGVFACGNVLHVHDLADFVTREALLAGQFAGEWAQGVRRPKDNIQLVPGDNVRYCVPHTLSAERGHTIYMRCKEPLKPCRIRVGNLMQKKLNFVVPAEMIMLRSGPTCSTSSRATRCASTSCPPSSASSAMAPGGDELSRQEASSSASAARWAARCSSSTTATSSSRSPATSATAGAKYARQEFTDPRRSLSTTVAIAGARWARLPVKTTRPGAQGSRDRGRAADPRRAGHRAGAAGRRAAAGACSARRGSTWWPRARWRAEAADPA